MMDRLLSMYEQQYICASYAFALLLHCMSANGQRHQLELQLLFVHDCPSPFMYMLWQMHNGMSETSARAPCVRLC